MAQGLLAEVSEHCHLRVLAHANNMSCCRCQLLAHLHVLFQVPPWYAMTGIDLA